MRGKRRASFTPRLKVSILDAVGDPPDIAKAIREFFPDISPTAYTSQRKLVESWLRDRAKLEALCKKKKGSNKKKARPSGVGTPLPPEAEQKLVVWINDLRKEGVPISSLMLESEALDVTEEYSVGGFKASWSWSTAHEAGTPFTMKAPDRIVMSKWIREAWDGLTSDVIISGYTKCYDDLVNDSDVVAADLISLLERQCALDREVGMVESHDDMDA